MMEASCTGNCQNPLATFEGDNEKPSFLPQPQDKMVGSGVGDQSMTPIGPWATGRVDWSPLGGLTGTRPVVDHYSITRYSDAEWRKHNEEILCTSTDDLHRVNMAEYNSRRALECITASADQNQNTSTAKLAERAHEILKWKNEVERAIEAMTEEIKLLEEQQHRANNSRSVLGIARSISSECIARRAQREGHELARDNVEEELIKEAALINEVTDLLNRTLDQIQEQLARDKAAKAKLEDDWSDKQETYNFVIESVGLTNRSDTILFKPAAARFTENQISLAGWENATREALAIAEAVRCQSCELRALLDGPILSDCIRDMKTQANNVDVALARRVAETEQCLKAMYAELDVAVKRNSESEKLILDLEYGVRGLDKATKVVQTRLNNLLQRPRVENCRDLAYLGLMDESKNLQEQTKNMKAQLAEAQASLTGLVRARGVLEKELQNKLKTLYIDKERCQVMRAQYPTATAMAGHS